MASIKNITMKQYNGTDYDTLYPKTIAAQIDDVYSKSETSSLFLPKAGGSMTGLVDMGGNRISSVGTPVNDEDAVNKKYVDGVISKQKFCETQVVLNDSTGYNWQFTKATDKTPIPQITIGVIFELDFVTNFTMSNSRSGYSYNGRVALNNDSTEIISRGLFVTPDITSTESPKVFNVVGTSRRVFLPFESVENSVDTGNKTALVSIGPGGLVWNFYFTYDGTTMICDDNALNFVVRYTSYLKATGTVNVKGYFVVLG